jgi:hypothetical protein
MKKLFLITIVLSLVWATNAQTTFTIPTPTAEQKYNTTRALLYNNILALITVAKDDGITAEELGRKLGKKFPWDENSTFEQLVNFMLFSHACLADSVKIIEQSNEKVVYISPHIYPNLENRGVIYGSTVEDLVAYFDGFIDEIANALGLSCDWTWGEEGLKIEIAQ